MSPEISILLPVYNGAAYLEAAVESALSQSFGDFELIIVDDCSTDESPAIIERMKARDSRVRAFTSEQNQGLFANYNRCLSLARGQYIKPYAQDDLLAVNCLERLLAVLKNDQSIALVSCARNIVDAGGKPVETISPFPKSRKIKGLDVILYNLIVLSNWVGEPSTVMFRKEFAGAGFDTNYFHFGDVDMWFGVLLNGDYYFSDEILASFRRHPDSASDKNLSGLLFALDAVLLGKKYRSVLEEFGEAEEHYLLRVAEFAAMQIDHLVRTEGLTAEKAIASAVKGAGIKDDSLRAQKILAAFVELNFISMRCLTHSLRELSDVKCRSQSDIEYLNKKLENINNSTTWKLTAPIRKLIGGQA